ncbi:winged helix-turn-helix transcriptional regulator [Flammeovirga yaeyamensis]|uniref:Winged helix-turn-helix transcriptional regulator n=1 Tax=Flammeovirga yaeyamensis TaxID=367791 RepID=A0AAX1N7Y2_9BACT|nr:helix-turn-helix domain-containing protein [Flammeovirga yaeyamensis]MBB3697934.1 DNA-binding HxlR family transcriptional regulator [Flammeovirga yaeyamensis]NMF35711.1 helix-turn-helix transcriptional regulator [Flammeovirga yaeyamensis]QWG03336.1 winged helix-turn-helix transcriptional regulator [Flammeovirga yaeyamensis]
MKEKDTLRSDCPINYALEFLGDKWTLLIIRDFIFDGKRFYKEFSKSKEKIATNILSDRLKRLEKLEIIKSEVYEKQKTQKIYTLTEKGLDLIPLLIEIIVWSSKYKEGLNVSEDFLEKLKVDKEGVIEVIRSKVDFTK